MNNLYLFTNQFPFCNGENCFGDPFLINEVPYLEVKFDNIYFIPRKEGDHLRDIPTNSHVICLHDNVVQNPSTKIRYLLNCVSFLRIRFIKNIFLCLKHPIDTRYSFFFKIKQLISYMYASLILRDNLKIDSADSNFFYCFWLNEWTLMLSLLKEIGYIKHFISRAHARGDLYLDKYNNTILQEYVVSQIDKIYPVSEYGEEYLCDRYPYFKEKIKVQYLGTRDFNLNPFIKSDEFVIVSCSTVDERKRVQIIVDALMLLQFDVRWIHFGDGVLLDTIKEKVKALPSNVIYELKGHTKNEVVMKFYQQQPVNLFINTSSEEGLPVSLMEAASFGIPLLATDASGNREIVNNDTGILLKQDAEATVIADSITTFRLSKKNTLDFRLEVRKYWEKKFSAEVNYPNFINDFTSLNNYK